jgi:recombination associated protein RdgC
MWPKNATIYGISPKAHFDLEQLQAARFVPIGRLDLVSSGFVPVRDGELAYKQGKHILLKFMTEKKVIPSSAVRQVVEARAAELEEQQGFPPGRKALKELKERAFDELLPRALTSHRSTLVWIDQDQHRIVVDTASPSAADDILRVLIKTFGDSLQFQDVTWPRAKVVTSWLEDEPADFTIDDAVVLQYPGEKGKVVKFERASAQGLDVLNHLTAGAAVAQVAMTYDSRVSFVMTENMQLRRIKPLDILKEREGVVEADRFDSDVALMTRELGVLIDALVQEAR